MYANCSVVSDSLQLHELQPSRLLCSWNSPGKKTGGQPFLSPRELPNSGAEPESSALHVDSLPSEPPRKPIYMYVYIQMEKSDNPTQYSCLEKPTDRGARQAIIHRVEKSRTQLRRLSMHAFIQKSLLSKCYLWTAYIRGQKMTVHGLIQPIICFCKVFLGRHPYLFVYVLSLTALTP